MIITSHNEGVGGLGGQGTSRKAGISEGSDRNYTIPRVRSHTSNMEESASKYEEILTSYTDEDEQINEKHKNVEQTMMTIWYVINRNSATSLVFRHFSLSI